MMPGTPILYGFTDLTDLRITMVKQEGSFRPARKQTKLSYKTVSSQAATRDPVFWKQPAISETNHTQTTLLRHPGGGGKVRLPQRPEVSPQQATPLPLPNRLRQPKLRPGIQSFNNIHKLHKLTRIKTGYKDKRPTQKQAPELKIDHTRLHTVSSRASACLTRDPVPRGGKVRLPQRPEVSPKQATPLPLPNRLRQPFT